MSRDESSSLMLKCMRGMREANWSMLSSKNMTEDLLSSFPLRLLHLREQLR
jgi:hypothetical protein